MIGGEPGSSSRSDHSSDSGGTCSKFFVIVVVVVLVNVIVVSMSLSLIIIGSRQVAVSDPAAAVTAEAAHLIDS